MPPPLFARGDPHTPHLLVEFSAAATVAADPGNLEPLKGRFVNTKLEACASDTVPLVDVGPLALD